QARSPAAAGEREQHASGDIERSVGAGKRGSQDDEIHHMAGGGNSRMTEDADKRTFAHPCAVPRHDSGKDDDGTEVYTAQGDESETNGAGDVFAGSRLAGGDVDRFDAA